MSCKLCSSILLRINFRRLQEFSVPHGEVEGSCQGWKRHSKQFVKIYWCWSGVQPRHDHSIYNCRRAMTRTMHLEPLKLGADPENRPSITVET